MFQVLLAFVLSLFSFTKMYCILVWSWMMFFSKLYLFLNLLWCCLDIITLSYSFDWHLCASNSEIYFSSLGLSWPHKPYVQYSAGHHQIYVPNWLITAHPSPKSLSGGHIPCHPDHHTCHILTTCPVLKSHCLPSSISAPTAPVQIFLAPDINYRNSFPVLFPAYNYLSPWFEYLTVSGVCLYHSPKMFAGFSLSPQ